jgi:hypothetical protein
MKREKKPGESERKKRGKGEEYILHFFIPSTLSPLEYNVC